MVLVHIVLDKLNIYVYCIVLDILNIYSTGYTNLIFYLIVALKNNTL